jgi:WD40-like Beta Propeller Repeat
LRDESVDGDEARGVRQEITDRDLSRCRQQIDRHLVHGRLGDEPLETCAVAVGRNRSGRIARRRHFHVLEFRPESRERIWAIAFDPARAQTRGTARVVVPQVVTLPTGVAEFDIADDGTLVYLVGRATSASPRNLVWVDRDGREDPIDAPPRAYVNVRLSPDGTRVATEIEGDGHDIWVWDFARKNLSRVTSDPGTDQNPGWTPDGRRLVFKTEAGGVLGALAMQNADGNRRFDGWPRG